MNFYGNQFLLNENVSDKLTIGEYIDLNIFLNESYTRILESFDEDDVLEEGANLDARKAFKAYLKEYKEYAKSLKKNVKEEDYSSAKKDLNKMKNCVDKMEKEIKDQDYNVGSAIFGYFATGLLNSLELLIPSFIAGFGESLTLAGHTITYSSFINGDISKLAAAANLKTVGTVVSNIGNIIVYIKSLIMIIKTISQFIKDINDKDTTTVEALNLYRNKLLTYVKDLRKKINEFEKLIDKKSKNK